MAYFIRWTETPEADLARGTSLHMTGLDEKYMAAELLGCEEDELKLVDNQWCQVLPGLCGYECESDEVEEAIQELGNAIKNGIDYFEKTFTLFEGEWMGGCPEGCIFRAARIIK
jgi:hypothetical protein